MPGIIGFTTDNMSPNSTVSILQKMQDLITYSSSYKKDDLFSDGQVCATRSHTNIIQKQPQPQHESGIYVWLDGEFYNQDVLSQQIKFPVNSDSELLLALFKLNNNFNFLKQIDGIYTAVIYDSHKQKVHLITDRYGFRHLYWSVYKGSLVWGSEVKIVLALPDFELKIDPIAVEEFFDIGFLIEDRTWLQGVELLSSGTVLTWDIQKQSSYKQRYWWWDEIKLQTGIIDENEVAEKLGRLFINAVERRSLEGEKVGLTLSGGLDSRAILAAIPEREYPIHAVTFGKKGCDDIRIATMAAKEKGAIHHIVEINKDNWLQSRLQAVWQTDGHGNLLSMHGMAAREVMKDAFQINLNGIAAGPIMGGLALQKKSFCDRLLEKTVIANVLGCHPHLIEKFDNYTSLSKIDFYMLQNKVRRSIAVSIKQVLTIMESRQPFYDNKLIEFIYSLPDELRFEYRIYKLMLLKFFPSFYNKIPWQKTGFSIKQSNKMMEIITLPRIGKTKFLKKLNRFEFKYNNPKNFTDYFNWIQQQPVQSFFKTMMENPSALYPEYVDREKAHNYWFNHLNDEYHLNMFCRLLTFEIWLQQLFKGNYRS